jgi:Protein of unknown function (DUF3553)
MALDDRASLGDMLATTLSNVPAPARLEIPVSYHDNIDSDIIRIGCDSLKLLLMKHERRIESRRSWIAPLGVAISTLAALLTAKFNSFLGLDGSVWTAVFILTFLCSLVWLLYLLLRLPGVESIDQVVDGLRHSEEVLVNSVSLGSALDSAATARTAGAKQENPSLASPTHPPGTEEGVSFRPGARVVHPKFGVGTVKVAGPDSITVDFGTRGLKTLSTAFAPLKKAD